MRQKLHGAAGRKLQGGQEIPVQHHKLQQQLRTVPVPGEADPAGDQQCIAGKTAAGIR